jgi:hypothetical protein
MEETQLYLAWSQQATFSTALKTNYQSREINSNVLGVGERVGEVQTTLQNVMKTYGSGLDALRESLDDVIKNAICKPIFADQISIRNANLTKGLVM